IACALAGPMPGNAMSSSLVAVLMFTTACAGMATNAASATASAAMKRVMSTSVVSGKRRASCSGVRSRYGRCRLVRHQPFDVARHPGGHVAHRRRVPRRAQRRKVSLREALVLADELRRELRVLDRPGTHEVRERKRRLARRLAACVDD